MQASPLTEGIVFALDTLLRGEGLHEGAAEYLVRSGGLSLHDPADRAVIHKMKAEESILPSTVTFIRKHGAKPTPAARRKAVRK